jgi:hypothetical protein
MSAELGPASTNSNAPTKSAVILSTDHFPRE